MITVINNEEALFESIEEIPYQELTETSAGGNIGTTAFKDVGIKLRVTPQIASDGTVQLIVNPVFSRLTGFTPNTDQPIVDRRETSTIVRVRSGQTFVLGGMRRRTETHAYTGVPYLKDVQFLNIGKLFRSRNDEVRESELLVFIKTDIITPTTKKLPREEMADLTGAEMLNRVPSALDIWPVGPFGSVSDGVETATIDFSEQLEAEPIPSPAVSSDRRQRHNLPRTTLPVETAVETGSQPASRFNQATSFQQRLVTQQNQFSTTDRVTRLPAVNYQQPPVEFVARRQPQEPSIVERPKARQESPRPRPSIWLAQTFARR
jgi:hypothetical protein